MKNWKYIKTGNEQKIIIPRNDMADTPDSAIAKEVYSEYLKSGKNKQQTLLNLLKKNPKGNRKTYEDTIERVVSAYEKRSLNESIEAQEWSMFKGLGKDAEKEIAYSEADKVDNLKRARNAMKTKNRKAIGTHFDMNDYGIDVGPWSWDWKGQAPDKKTMQEIARKIKDYARQIDKDVPEGDSDERDEVFAKLDRFMQTQGLK